MELAKLTPARLALYREINDRIAQATNAPRTVPEATLALAEMRHVASTLMGCLVQAYDERDLADLRRYLLDGAV